MKKKQNKADSETKKKYKRFFGNQFARKYYESDIEKLADDIWAWLHEKDKNGNESNFYFQKFCAERGFSQQRISEFARQNEYFGYVYELCKINKEEKLVRLGLTKNPIMPIFLLKKQHDMDDAPPVVSQSDLMALVSMARHHAEL